MTIIIDDAGYGDILFGVVIGAYKPETEIIIYDVIDVKFFQGTLFKKKKYLEEASKIALKLVKRLEPSEDEKLKVCQGDILNKAGNDLIQIYGESRVERERIDGEAQNLIEQAYMDELRNIGYEPIHDRTKRWGKSFWHMHNWVKDEPKRIRWVKTGFPKLKRYKIFRS